MQLEIPNLIELFGAHKLYSNGVDSTPHGSVGTPYNSGFMYEHGSRITCWDP